MDTDALFAKLADVSPVAALIGATLLAAPKVLHELRILIVQLYALRGSKVHQRPPIISALAQLYAESPSPPIEESNSPPPEPEQPP